MLSNFQLALCALGALGAGLVNALAGGGTLITFPILVAMGVPPIAANVTNTVALCPGYLGATFAQWSLIREQQHRLRVLVPISVIGGLFGGILLLHTSQRAFRGLVPFLILLACALLALQEPIKKWLTRRATHEHAHASLAWSALPVFLATIYGGYFGAGVGVILVAVLGLFVEDNLTRANALKQSISLVTNVAAAVFFLFSDQVLWKLAIVMAIGGLLGGALGGRLASYIRPAVLRWIVLICGTTVGIAYLIKL